MDYFAFQPDPTDHDRATLWCEGVHLRNLAESVGTPLYVYSKKTIIDHARRFVEAFAPLAPSVHYAAKANPSLEVLRLIVAEGLGIDVVSGGELERAWLAGCPVDRVVFAGVGKTEREIRAALDGRFSPFAAAGERGIPDPAQRGPVGRFNIESEGELERLASIAAELGVVAKAALRVNPNVDARTHEYTTTGLTENKFGVPAERATAFFERAAELPSVTLEGLHVHLGSPIYEVEPYAQGIEVVLGVIDQLAAAGHRVSHLNLGGGFGADYETGKSPWARDYARVLVPMLEERARNGLRIGLEPGRTIMANAGVLLTQVQYVKQNQIQGAAGKRFLICDAGMNALVRPSLYKAFHFAWPIECDAARVPSERVESPTLPGLSTADVVGPLCETGDLLAKDRLLPDVAAGDVLAIYSAGAYGRSMAMTYNEHPLPAEVMVSGEAWRLIRRAGTPMDLVRPELGLGTP